MAETQHTPGPWKVGYRALDIVAANPKGGEVRIFDVRGWGFLTGKGHGILGLSEDEAEAVQHANAQLAAAAPDLLAALKEATDRLQQALSGTGTDAEFAEFAVAKYRLAIAKAEGRS